VIARYKEAVAEIEVSGNVSLSQIDRELSCAKTLVTVDSRARVTAATR
jgi:hypothetical protein